ncbi:hypothetical protein LWI29_035899 [Acer saccharum]|uniref:Uncharacterized protein n=1 Tax=Acer saccharum TaxID=4024 RepID=A0AA39T5T2_ACESA|nr:hypothetical protein LWI29_035899 [Acer saccharum]
MWHFNIFTVKDNVIQAQVTHTQFSKEIANQMCSAHVTESGKVGVVVSKEGLIGEREDELLGRQTDGLSLTGEREAALMGLAATGHHTEAMFVFGSKSLSQSFDRASVVEECIEPTVGSKKSSVGGGSNIGRVGNWKKAARNKAVREGGTNQGLLCGKRKDEGGVSQPLKASNPDLQQRSNFKLQPFQQTLEETSVFKIIPYDGRECKSIFLHSATDRSADALDCKIDFLAGLFQFIWCFQLRLADLRIMKSLQGPVVATNFLFFYDRQFEAKIIEDCTLI